MLYALGVLRVTRLGGHWPVWRTIAFYLLGLGSFAVINFGFLGVYSIQLRWAFTTRIALLLFAVPAFVVLGRPLTLLRESLRDTATLERILRTRIVRLFGNAVFATLFALAAFSIFLTPIAWTVRGTPAINESLALIVPLIGLLMVLPIAEDSDHRTNLFIVAEFMLAFVELVIDAIPGILLRLNDSILDHAPALTGTFPSWWPSAYHDQHLSGDLLWFIAEVADIPVLILLFIRWRRSDRREARSFDDLSDEEMDAMMQEHLKRGNS